MGKYIKLKGYETPTPENERQARKFMRWFGLRLETMRKEWLYSRQFDDGIATDTALYIYDCIALKGLRIKGKYKWYFLRAYHMRVLAEKKKAARISYVYLDDPDETIDIAAPDFDYEAFEAIIDAVSNEMLEYVRNHYAPIDVSLFEIYIALQPDFSYKKLARMIGYPEHKIWPVIGKIKKDLAANFLNASDFLRTLK